MFDLMSRVQIAELERLSRTDLNINESFEEAMARFQEDRRRESCSVAEDVRKWWLTEQGWLVADREHSSTSRPSTIDEVLRQIGQFLIRCGTALQSRAVSAANASAGVTPGTRVQPSQS